MATTLLLCAVLVWSVFLRYLARFRIVRSFGLIHDWSVRPLSTCLFVSPPCIICPQTFYLGCEQAKRKGGPGESSFEQK